MAYCSNCGAQVPEGSAFCPQCGAPVKTNTAPTAQTVVVSNDGTQGHGLSVGSLVCGIIGIVCWFSGYGSLFSIVLGIVGLILAGNAKKGGNTEGIRTAGFIVSLIALIGGCLVFLYLVLAIALVGAAWQGIFNLPK